MNRPWIVRQKINDRRYRVVARFTNESDADGYKNSISKQLERNDYEVAYEPTNLPIGSLIQLALVSAVFLPLLGCTASELWQMGNSLDRLLVTTSAKANAEPALEELGFDGRRPLSSSVTITRAQVQSLTKYDLRQNGQSTRAIHDLLGLPLRYSTKDEVWEVAGTSDGILRASTVDRAVPRQLR